MVYRGSHKRVSILAQNPPSDIGLHLDHIHLVDHRAFYMVIRIVATDL